MKITIMNPKIFPKSKAVFTESLSDKSKSTDLNNEQSKQSEFKSSECLFTSPEKTDQSKECLTPKKDFCSIENEKQKNSHTVSLSAVDLTQSQKKKKKLNLQCDKKCGHQMEVNYLHKDAFLLNMKGKRNELSPPNIFLNPPLFSRSDIAVEFFQFSSDFKDSKWKELMFAGRLKKKNNFKFGIDYQLLEMTLLAFFQMKNIQAYTKKLNDYEYIFISIFLYKKNFLKWSSYNIDFNELQFSKSKKRKEHFLKFLLKKFFKYLSGQKQDFFGEGNSKITNRMKSIFFESNKRRKDDPNSNRMENLGKILSQNKKFKEFYDSCDMDSIILQIFNDYNERQMKTLVQNHIARLKEDMKKNVGNPFLAFSNVVFGLMKKKLKIMWTFMEFKQAQEVLDAILNN
jgi:hypothetical protein